LFIPAAIVGFEIVAAVVSDLLPHRRRAVIECIMAEGKDVFLDTQSPAGTGDIVGFGGCVNGFAVNAAMMVAFPYALFDGLGNGARLSALA
jgi:hypothetical protein